MMEQNNIVTPMDLNGQVPGLVLQDSAYPGYTTDAEYDMSITSTHADGSGAGLLRGCLFAFEYLLIPAASSFECLKKSDQPGNHRPQRLLRVDRLLRAHPERHHRGHQR